MKTFTSRNALVLIPAALVAQAPSPTPAQPTFTQILRSGAPEVEKLMSEFKFRDAALKAEGILPTTVPAWDKSSPQ
ncbi:MAG: hypothetical protein Q8O00_02240, partial [Holophaga sp.]|nr:hypothetical protein [Holophaga sp.]